MYDIVISGFTNGYLEKAALLEGIGKWWEELSPEYKGMLLGAPIGMYGGYMFAPEGQKIFGTLAGGLGGGALGGITGYSTGKLLEEISKLQKGIKPKVKKIKEKTKKAVEEYKKVKQVLTEKPIEYKFVEGKAYPKPTNIQEAIEYFGKVKEDYARAYKNFYDTYMKNLEIARRREKNVEDIKSGVKKWVKEKLS